MRGADEFTREDIEDLFAALDVRLQARGVAALAAPRSRCAASPQIAAPRTLTR